MSESGRKPNANCSVCNKAVYRRPGVLKLSGGKAYCSQNCYGQSCRKEKPCLICGKKILAGDNKKTCSRTCSNKNRVGIKYTGRRMKDNVSSQKRLKVRLLKERGGRCERCKYSVIEILQVHHKDRNRSNNKLENLELLCPNCHACEHYLKI